jgi:hypothetical protein
MGTYAYAVLELEKGQYQYCRLLVDGSDKTPPESLVPGVWYDNVIDASNCQAALKVLRRDTGVFEFAIAADAGNLADTLIDLADAVRDFDPEKFDKYLPEFEEVLSRMAALEDSAVELLALLALITPRSEEDRR